MWRFLLLCVQRSWTTFAGVSMVTGIASHKGIMDRMDILENELEAAGKIGEFRKKS